jgi:hypothetical protein
MDNFFQVDNDAIKLLPAIGHSAFVVYSALKMYMNKQTKECFPSQEKLAAVCCMDKRRILRAIKTLEIYGLINVKRQQRKPNIYYLRDKTSWGEDIYSLGKGIIMRCPECDLPVVRDRAKGAFICPQCHMDVGNYVQEVLGYHYPGISSQSIFGRAKKAWEINDSYGYPDSFYEALVGNDHEGPLPESHPVTVHVDFESGKVTEVRNAA